MKVLSLSVVEAVIEKLLSKASDGGFCGELRIADRALKGL